MRLRACFVFVFFLVLGCSGTHEVQWRIAFVAGLTPPVGSSVVHAEVRANDCTGAPLLAFDRTLDGAMTFGMSTGGTVRAGTYGLSIEVRDATCQVVAKGCLPITLPSSAAEPYVVTVSAATGAACTTAMCMGNGYCGPTMLLDLGPPDMGSMPDVPPIDAPGTDLGGMCSGCTMGSTCMAGIGQTTCGTGGGMCSSCSGSQECSNGACVTRHSRFALSPIISFLESSDGHVYSAGGDIVDGGTAFPPQRGAITNTPGSFVSTSDSPGSSGSVVALAATQFVTCAIDNGGTLYCWGQNALGLLGRAGAASTTAATPVGSAHWAAISGGNQHFCGIQVDGSLWCWGDGSDGKLGTGSTTQQPVPMRVDAPSLYIAISAGNAHTCGIRADHTLWCWGANEKGQLGIGTTTAAGTPTSTPHQEHSNSTDWIAVSASNGASHTCGIRAPGSLYCWGDITSGQLGLGYNATMNPSSLPVPVTDPTQVGTDTTWSEVSAGQFHTCGIRGTQALCWGFGGFGELGDATNTEADSPTILVGTWEHVSASWHWSCGVTDSGSRCWGDARTNQLGTGTDRRGVTPSFESSPVAIAPSGL